MRFIFFLSGLFAYFLGGLFFINPQGAINETVALLIILNGTIFIVGAGILDAMHNNPPNKKKTITKAPQKTERIEPTFTAH